jgi:putative ABC transport system permease protein
MRMTQTLRGFVRAPGFTLTTLLTLAVGIGATTAIFSVVNGVLIQPLAYADSDRLIELRQRSANTGGNWLPISPPLYFTYRDHSETLESVAMWMGGIANVTGLAEPEEVQVLRTTFELLSTLGVVPELGRGFVASDDAVGGPKTVVLSHAYWQRRFGGAADAVGRTLVVDGAPHEIVGVLPQQFAFGRNSADLLLPMQPNRATAFVGPLGEGGVARMRAGVTLEEVNTDLARLYPVMLTTFPSMPGMNPDVFTNLRLAPAVVTLKDAVVGDLDDVLWILLGTIGILLLVACANVANLSLVRTEGRSRELAVRAALGASRARLCGALLLESALLALAGGVLGLLVAAVALPSLLTFAAGQLPPALAIRIDPAVVAFALAVSVGAGLLFGALPALKYTAERVARLPVAGRAHTEGRDRRYAQRALVVGQVALALVLLVAAGLMIRSFQELRAIDPGFVDPDEVQTVSIAVPQSAVPEFPRVIGMLNGIQDRLAAIPAVESVGFVSRLPLELGPSAGFFLEDKPGAEGVAPPQSEFRYTSPNLFETLGTPLVAGRTFDWADHRGAARVVIVSENLARREWGAPAEALGKRLRMFPTEPWGEIVGVVGDVRHEVLEEPAPTAVYMTLGDPLAQFIARRVSFAIRSERVGTAGLLQDIQQAIWSVDPNLALARVETLGDVYDRSMARTSLTLVLLGITATMALLLGLLGIYSVISYMLAQRTREMGIRMALGARSSSLRRLLLGHVVALVAVGVAVGLVGAAGLTQLMESLLYGVAALDLVTYAAVCAVLVVTALVAAYLPARRVTRIQPTHALREE